MIFLQDFQENSFFRYISFHGVCFVTHIPIMLISALKSLSKVESMMFLKFAFVLDFRWDSCVLEEIMSILELYMSKLLCLCVVYLNLKRDWEKKLNLGGVRKWRRKESSEVGTLLCVAKLPSSFKKIFFALLIGHIPFFHKR